MKQTLTRATKLKLLAPFTYLCAAVVLFVCTWSVPVNIHECVGASLSLVAFTLWIIARIQLGNAFSLAPSATFIVRSGLYSKLRHPVYYFSILAVAGISIYLWNPATIILVFGLVTLEVVRMRKEEAILEQSFGKEYVSYKRATWF